VNNTNQREKGVKNEDEDIKLTEAREKREANFPGK
jgi:hypothetical protein